MSIRSFLVAMGGASLLALSAVGCSSSFVMAPDSAVPFAKGEVDASFEENGNGKMKLRVEHLGDPAKLKANATTYVVWVKPVAKDGNNKPQNVGALKVDDDYSGELEFSTTFRHFDITITPEESAEVSVPAGRDVLKTTVNASE